MYVADTRVSGWIRNCDSEIEKKKNLSLILNKILPAPEPGFEFVKKPAEECGSKQFFDHL